MTMRIIFVDDEADVLRGLRRVLRSKRGDWDIHFAHGGAEALEYMSQNETDIIVTDMRMPDVDGCSLLIEVAKKWPKTRRFILSGQAESATVQHVIGVSHQFWAKPFDAGVLLGRLERIAQDITEDTRSFLPTLQSLPSLTETIQELYGLLAKENVDKAAVANAIGDDMAMSAKMLQLSNSAFFGVGHKTLLPGNAVRTLGLDLIGQLMEKPGCCRLLEPHHANVDAIEPLLKAATSAAKLSDKLMAEFPDSDLNAVLLRQLCKFLPLGAVLNLIQDDREETMTDMSVQFMRLWGFPCELVEAFEGLYEGDPFRPEILIAANVAEVLFPAHVGSEKCRLHPSDWDHKIHSLIKSMDIAL